VRLSRLVIWSLPVLAVAAAVAVLTLDLGSDDQPLAGADCHGAADAPPLSGESLRLASENPRYLSVGGEPTPLITSGEHYGAVINADFDYVPYLDEIAAYGFNQTRLFAGSYFNPSASLESEALKPIGYNNTLAPKPGRLVSPWARTEDERFDLQRWNPEYFERLRDFVAEAERRGIVVELTLFSNLYSAEIWNASPLNAANNVNRVGSTPRQVFTLDNGPLLEVQEDFVRKHVSELRSFANVYYEVINEPYPRLPFTPVTDEWQTHIIETIEDAESELPDQHLIARNYDHTTGPIGDPHPSVSIHNFHYERDPSRYENLDGVLAFDETGFQGIRDTPYRTDAWYFMLSGGGIYSNLDWSFTPEVEDGSFELPPDAPGGGGPSLRCQLSVLKAFLERFELSEMAPNHELADVAPPGATVRVLADPGREYAVYLGDDADHFGLEAPKGRYEVEWIETTDGAVAQRERIDHPGGGLALVPPPYAQDMALAVERVERENGE
jgi:hypothetical protein